jgi:hypothetical protein
VALIEVGKERFARQLIVILRAAVSIRRPAGNATRRSALECELSAARVAGECVLKVRRQQRFDERLTDDLKVGVQQTDDVALLS